LDGLGSREELLDPRLHGIDSLRDLVADQQEQNRLNRCGNNALAMMTLVTSGICIVAPECEGCAAGRPRELDGYGLGRGGWIALATFDQLAGKACAKP
jgi:hypothetical protein